MNKKSKTTPDIECLAQILIERKITQLQRFHPGVKKAFVFMAENFENPISLGEIAKASHLSASRLEHLFNETLGVNFKTFLAMIRIKKAQKLLARHPYLKITAIYSKVGFGSVSQFNRSFRRIIGVTPREYRQELRR